MHEERKDKLMKDKKHDDFNSRNKDEEKQDRRKSEKQKDLEERHADEEKPAKILIQ